MTVKCFPSGRGWPFSTDVAPGIPTLSNTMFLTAACTNVTAECHPIGTTQSAGRTMPRSGLPNALPWTFFEYAKKGAQASGTLKRLKALWKSSLSKYRSSFGLSWRAVSIPTYGRVSCSPGSWLVISFVGIKILMKRCSSFSFPLITLTFRTPPAPFTTKKPLLSCPSGRHCLIPWSSCLSQSLLSLSSPTQRHSLWPMISLTWSAACQGVATRHKDLSSLHETQLEGNPWWAEFQLRPL